MRPRWPSHCRARVRHRSARYLHSARRSGERLTGLRTGLRTARAPPSVRSRAPSWSHRLSHLPPRYCEQRELRSRCHPWLRGPTCESRRTRPGFQRCQKARTARALEPDHRRGLEPGRVPVREPDRHSVQAQVQAPVQAPGLRSVREPGPWSVQAQGRRSAREPVQAQGRRSVPERDPQSVRALEQGQRSARVRDQRWETAPGSAPVWAQVRAQVRATASGRAPRPPGQAARRDGRSARSR